MKLKFDVDHKNHPDPFVLDDNGKYYLYPSTAFGGEGVRVYSADDPIRGEWKYEGIAARFDGATNYWAPSVVKFEGKYYIYVSFERGESHQFMHVAEADSPLGPFTNEKMLYREFSIDSHAVVTDAGLFLLYAKNKYKPDYEDERIGTRIFIDKMIDPYTPSYNPVEKVVPDFDEEIFTPQYSKDCRWHTIEGPFWFCEGDYQYLTYSGGCYEDDTYHVGYAIAKSKEQDLTKVEFNKVTKNGGFNPIIIKNDFEEGTGHHSMIKYNGEYYAFYHGRDIGAREKKKITEIVTVKDDSEVKASDGYKEIRTARVCKILVNDGELSAIMKENYV